MTSPFTIDIRPRRIPIEIRHIEETSRNHGIHCSITNDAYDKIIATIPGPKDTPFEDIRFKISMEFDSQYPFHPPAVKFVTPVYHPNIDRDGKICLDVLQMPPSGSYNPAITLESILLSIQLLLGSPNPDDPLRNDVADEYKYNRELYNQNAKKYSGNVCQKDKKKLELSLDVSDSPNGIQPMEQSETPSDDGRPTISLKAAAAANAAAASAAAASSDMPTGSRLNRKRKHEGT